MNLDHGAPIEDVAFFSSGTYTLSGHPPNVRMACVTELRPQFEEVHTQKSAMHYGSRGWRSSISNMLVGTLIRMLPNITVLQPRVQL